MTDRNKSPLRLGHTKIQLPYELVQIACKKAIELSQWEDLIREQIRNGPLPGFPEAGHAGVLSVSQKLDIDLVRECWKNGFIGLDPYTTRQLMPEIKTYGSTDAALLITGETGTGKEEVAKCIHNLGKRKDKKFVAVNCAGIPETMLESELFGHKKGAFTGATADTNGLIKEAEGGTLFLDEIGDMPVALQAKMLRFLNSKEYYRLGETKPNDADVRIISATNQDLEEGITEKKFRRDLYYRLGGRKIHIWPLYLRPGDLSILLFYFISKYNEDHPEAQIKEVSLEAYRQAMCNRWPGNIREFQDAIERNLDISVAVGQKGLWNFDKIQILEYDTKSPEFSPGLISKVQSLEGLVTLVDVKVAMEYLDRYLQPPYRGRWKFAEKVKLLTEESLGESIEPVDPFEAICNMRFCKVERQYARTLLDKYNGNASKAGRFAGLDGKTLKKWANRNMDG